MNVLRGQGHKEQWSELYGILYFSELPVNMQIKDLECKVRYGPGSQTSWFSSEEANLTGISYIPSVLMKG